MELIDRQAEQQGRVLKEIVVEYPSYNTYPEYEGKPYFSIKYTENGQEFIGYGTYKPEVLSEYLKEYFMSSAQTDLIAKIQNGIKATDVDDIYFCGMRNGMRWCISLIDGKEPLYENCPSAQPEPRWIPCSERLPETRVEVLICYREWQQYIKRYVYTIVNGWYARKYSVKENVFNEWEDILTDCDYKEDEDEFYIPEGWYEYTTQGNSDLMNWFINAEVIAWMPLPEPYREDGEKE